MTTAMMNYIRSLAADEAAALMRGDGDRTLKDGERIRRPLLLMDGNTIPVRDVITPPPDIIAPRTRAGILSDEQLVHRDACNAAREAALTNAWRSPPSTFAPAAAPTLDASADVYDRHEFALVNAWRSPPAAEPVTAAPSPQQYAPQDSEQLYAARDRKLTEAWRHA